MEKPPKFKKIKDPYNSRTYEREAVELALSWIDMKPCRHCGHPVVKGYCCGTCGSGNP